jgi:hypothetical protein
MKDTVPPGWGGEGAGAASSGFDGESGWNPPAHSIPALLDIPFGLGRGAMSSFFWMVVVDFLRGFPQSTQASTRLELAFPQARQKIFIDISFPP